MSDLTPAQWKSAWATLTDYWNAYGGWRGIVASPYLALAVASTALAYPYWTAGKLEWVQNAIDIVPGLLGFSIGAFAVLLVFSSDKFLRLIAQRGDASSVFMQTSAMFVHFIILQTLALIFAVGTKVFPALSGIGFFFLSYAMFTAIAAAFALFNLAQVYNHAAHYLDADEQIKRSAGSSTDHRPVE